jgi:hypothetical protein
MTTVREVKAGSRMANYHITVRGAGRTAMADLVRVHHVRVYPQTLHERADQSSVDAVADEEAITRLQNAGYAVQQHEDVDADARESLQHVSHGNRFEQAAGEDQR